MKNKLIKRNKLKYKLSKKVYAENTRSEIQHYCTLSYDSLHAHNVIQRRHFIPAQCMGSPGIIHDRTPDCHSNFLGMDAKMTS